jgi:cytochrome P460
MKALMYMLLVLSSNLVLADTNQLQNTTFSQYVDKAGNISLPTDYRATWTHIGSWLVADKKAPGHGFHDVYMQPEAAAYYRNTQQYADGTVMIKEVRKLEEAFKTTGKAQWAGDIKVWFVMVKDTQGRFKDNLHWADGWGWALFENKEKAETLKNVSVGYEITCKGCHLPAKQTDSVFIEGYPTLTE